MIEKSKKHKKGIITEEDISTILQRYTANTVLALLQEVAQFEGVKIDWTALVKKTSTGISNVREYQMLWRHLAYRHALVDKLDDGAQPLDDDSDLECELEAFPDVSSEASTEAAACVKVLIASGLPSDSTHPNGTMVEAPLTINIPNGQPVRFTSENLQLSTMKGMNITVPVSVQKQPLPAVTSAEGTDGNGSASGTIPPRRKRKPWSESEDLELIAAVQKYGEGNWANILRSELKWDRTASQLSQRWTIIRKKHGNSNVGANTSGVQLTEAQRAARHAMNLALDPPTKNTFTNSAGEPSSSQHQFQRSFTTKPSSMGPLISGTKTHVAVKKLMKPDTSSDLVKAVAVAAGARIATPSDAASLIKAAHAKVYIMSTGGSSIKSVMPGGASNQSEARSNVQSASLSTHPAVNSSGSHPASVKASSPTTQRAPPISDVARNMSSGQANTELPSKQDSDSARRVKILSEDVAKEQVQEHQASVSRNELSNQACEEKAALPNHDGEIKTQVAVEQGSNASQKLEVAESGMVDVLSNEAEQSHNSNGDKVTGLSAAKDENQSLFQENGDDKRTSDKQAVLPSIATNECSKKVEAASKAEPDSEMTKREG